MHTHAVQLESKQKEINERAVNISKKFIEQGSECEINISGKERVKVELAIETAIEEDTLVKLNIFEQCQMEIYKLLNQDTFERFKNNDKLLDEMLGKLFDEADIDSDGSITIVEYKKWAKNNPGEYTVARRCPKE